VLIISIIFLSFVVLTITASQLFLRPYYLKMKEQSLSLSYHDLEHIDFTAPEEEIFIELEKIEEKRGIHIYIIDGEYHEFYCAGRSSNIMRSIGEKDSGKKWFSPWMVPDNSENPSKVFTETPIISERMNERLSSGYLSLYAKLMKEDLSGAKVPFFVIINVPVSAVEDGITVISNFAIIAAVLILIAGIFVTYFMSMSIVRPIVNITRATKKMANLDFSAVIPVRSNDEIGELSNDINYLSSQLEMKINELREANIRLTEDIREKEAMDRMKKDLVSSVSHELKTPLSIILGYCEGLEYNINSSEREYYCSVIKDEAEKMNALAERILSLAELQSGSMVLRLERFDLSELAGERCAKFSILADERKVAVTCEAEGDCTVTADRLRIEEVVNNLLSNALNHTPENGRVEVSVTKKIDEIELIVYNSGSSIPQESLPHIWESFYKADKARTRKYSGAGLGLSIARAVLQSHSDSGIATSCRAENTDGGVRFTVTLAADTAADTGADTDSDSDSDTGNDKGIDTENIITKGE
jgi:signal transduction histidine kinase